MVFRRRHDDRRFGDWQRRGGRCLHREAAGNTVGGQVAHAWQAVPQCGGAGEYDLQAQVLADGRGTDQRQIVQHVRGQQVRIVDDQHDMLFVRDRQGDLIEKPFHPFGVAAVATGSNHLIHDLFQVERLVVRTGHPDDAGAIRSQSQLKTVEQRGTRRTRLSGQRDQCLIRQDGLDQFALQRRLLGKPNRIAVRCIQERHVSMNGPGLSKPRSCYSRTQCRGSKETVTALPSS